MSVGVFGGAFDPPHLGHTALARTGAARFGLDRLLVRVIASPGHKAVETPAETRLLLAELAFAELAIAEVALDPHPRTVDSLTALGLDDPVFLIGADEFASLHDWKSPDRLLELARLGVAARPGYPRERLDGVLRGLAHPERVTFFELEPHAVSSSMIRRLAGAGASLDGLVAPAVAEQIERLRLYRPRDAAADDG